MYVLIFYKISKKETIRISLLLSLIHLLQDYCSYFRKLDNLKVFSILNEDNLQDHIGENCSKVPDIGIARSCLHGNLSPRRGLLLKPDIGTR